MKRDCVVLVRDSIGGLLLLRGLLANPTVRVTHAILSTELLPGRGSFSSLGSLVSRNRSLFLAHRIYDRFVARLLCAVYRFAPSGQPVTVRQLCAASGIMVRECSAPEAMKVVADLRPELLLSLYFGHILPAETLAHCRAPLNVHTALLPRNRGLFPEFRVLLNGEAETGVSLHVMNERVDTGACIATRAFSPAAGDSVMDLHYKATLLAQGILSTLDFSTLAVRRDAPSTADPETPVFGWPTNGEYLALLRRGKRCVRPLRHPFLVWSLLGALDPYGPVDLGSTAACCGN